MQQWLITVNVHEGCYFLSTQINLRHVLETSAFGTDACYESCTPLDNGYVSSVLFNAVPNVYCNN